MTSSHLIKPNGRAAPIALTAYEAALSSFSSLSANEKALIPFLVSPFYQATPLAVQEVEKQICKEVGIPYTDFSQFLEWAAKEGYAVLEAFPDSADAMGPWTLAWVSKYRVRRNPILSSHVHVFLPEDQLATVDLVDSMTPLVKNAPATASFAVALNSQQRQQPPRSATLSPATLATPVVAPSPVSGTFLQQQQQQQSRSATATLATPVMAPSPVSGMFLHYDATASLKAPRNTARFSPIPQTPPMCPTPILPCTSQSSFVEVSGPTGRDIGFLAEEPSSPLSGFQHLQVLPEASPAPTSPSTTSTSSSKRKRSPSVQADDARPHKKKATNPLLRRATTNSFYGVSHSPNPSGAPLAPAHSTGASQPSSPLLDASVIYTKGASSSAFDVQDAAFSFSFRA